MKKEEVFKEVEISKYMKEKIENGELIVKVASKSARVYARVGIVGEKIITTLKDGLVETINVVKADEETNNPDWVVCNPDGERYIVTDVVFNKKYELDAINPKMYKPKGGPVNVAQIYENIQFLAPWGEIMKIRTGGFIVINSETDIYGIQEQEFNNTYSIAENPKVKQY
jgi:hypothetical protein